MTVLWLLLGVGLWFSIGTGFWQIRNFKLIFAKTLGKIFSKHSGKGITPFQAMSTALASTVGTGNVAGVATAITAGGAGAVFWMWISAFLGMMTKFAEVTLAVHYRYKDKDGNWRGGPMITIERGLGRGWKWLAVLFSVFGLLASLGMGNITQVNTMAQTLYSEFSLPPLITGAAALLLAGVVILGGIGAIAKVSEYLVPFMAGIYIIAAMAVLVIFRESILPCLASICVEAFHPRAAAGGAAGIAVTQAVRMGVGRGVFSNEAGLGSAPIAHAQAEVKHPVEQGMWGAMEVFIDTIVICTMTALVILCAAGGSLEHMPALDGAGLTAASFSMALGDIGGKAVSVCTTLFALATVLGWAFYGEQCCAYLCRAKWVKTAYRCVYLFLLVPGAVMNTDAVWNMADFLNALMAAPNLISLLALSGTVFKLTRQYSQ